MEGVKIVIVDDEKQVRQFLQEAFEDKYQIFTIDDATKCYELVNGINPHVIIADIQLPDENGLDMVREIHQRRPDLPVIMITGMADTQIAIEAIKLHVWDFFQKPFPVEDILQSTVKAIEMSQMKRLNREMRGQVIDLTELLFKMKKSYQKNFEAIEQFVQEEDSPGDVLASLRQLLGQMEMAVNSGALLSNLEKELAQYSPLNN